MADGDEDDDGSEQRLRDLIIVIPIAVLWLGVPAVILTYLWLAAFVIIEHLTSIDIPSVTVGIVAAVGGPPTISGVSTLLAIVTGLATWLVWFVRYGRHGGDSGSGKKFAERHWQEDNWNF